LSTKHQIYCNIKQPIFLKRIPPNTKILKSSFQTWHLCLSLILLL